MRTTHPDDDKPWDVMTLDRDADSSPHSRSIIGAQPAANNDTQHLEMTTALDHQWHEINSAKGRSQRRLVAQVIFAGAAAIAMLALFGAASQGTGDNTVPSGSVRLVDQATDVPAPPPPPEGPPPGVLLAPGMTWPPGTPLQQGPSMVLPGGLPLPPLPQGMALSPELQQEISQMYMQGQEMLAAGPPPNVPNEVCRYNTVRVPCPS
jgi:hypothetical protein